MSEHTCRIVFDDSMLARKWGVFCLACQQMIGACQSEADAQAVGENHARWQKIKADFHSADTKK